MIIIYYIWYLVWSAEYRRPRPMEASAQRCRPMAMETSAQANDLNGLNAIGCVSRVSGGSHHCTCSNLICLINNINIKYYIINIMVCLNSDVLSYDTLSTRCGSRR